MKSDPVHAALMACSMFSKIEGESLRPILAMAQPKRWAKGERIFSEGDEAPGIFVVSRGLIRVFKSAPNGKEHVLHLAGRGTTFAEIAVLGQFSCPAHAEAIEDSEGILLPAGEFMAALRRDPGLSLQLMTGLSFWVRNLIGLMDGIVLKDAVGRVAAWLLDEAKKQGRANRVSVPGLKKHIASHLNLTSETLSRTLRQLKEAGLIEEPAENLVKIPDPERLRTVGEGNFPRI